MASVQLPHHSPNVVIAAGGTGGHLMPALAVAKALTQKGYQIHWLGASGKIESELVPAEGYPFKAFEVLGVRRQSKWVQLVRIIQQLKAFWVARQYMKSLSPVAFVSFGGFTSAFSGLAARSLNLPVVIHEQNAKPGLTNRLLSRIADSVAVAYPEAFANHPKQVVTGNPLRQSFNYLAQQATTAPQATPNPINLLVLGGSLGARQLNQWLPIALGRLANVMDITVTHQTGAQAVESTLTAYKHCAPQGLSVNVVPFIQDMASAYQNADFIIARAGALTISEIQCARVPCLLIPYPHAVDDHQWHNATPLVTQGMAARFRESELSADKLFDWLLAAFSENGKFDEMRQCAANHPLQDATASLVAVIESQHVTELRSAAT